MEYCRLGMTTMVVSRLGFGCAAMGGYDYGRVRDEESCRAVERALDLGINFFDTADVYGFGHAEEVLGRALGIRRRDVVIATKFGVRWDAGGRTIRDTSPAWIAQAVEGSLKRLGVDRISLYQIHWPDGRTPLEETLDVLERLREAGKIRAVGCCNVDGMALEAMQVCTRVESLQLPYSLLEREWGGTIQHGWRQHAMAVLSYSSLGQGLLTGKYNMQSRFEGTDLRRRSPLFQGERLRRNLATVERLAVVARRHKRTPAQVAIRWILDEGGIACTLTGAKSPAQIEENAGALGWALAPEDWAFLAGEGGSARDPGQAHGVGTT